MNSTPSPMGRHPASGRTDSPLVVCSKTKNDNTIQDIHSGHSQSTAGDRNQQRSPATISSSAANNYENKQHDNNTTTTTRMNLIKTEYKSNFTPFDQYVYNEVTDTFVKQHHCKTTVNSNNLLIESGNNHAPLSAASSNHDLSGNSMMAHGVESQQQQQHHSMSRHAPAAGAVSPAGIETGLFEPHANGTEHHDATSEPWYMEVMKRNEKAHEYRFKSEIGHNSPLLAKSGASNEDLIRRSPLGNDPLTEAQIREQQQLAAGTLDSTTGNSKQTFRFSPHDYKRDHLIAHMANNNNFKLPKDANDEAAAGRVASTRRVPATSTLTSSRPLTRTTAASRARSQSSRRQVAAATPATKAEPATRSNQTTPVRSVPSSRVPTTATSTRLARTSQAKTTTTAPTTTTSAARPTTAATRVSAAKTSSGPAQNGTTRPTTAARRPLTATATPTTKATTPRSTTTAATRPSVTRAPTTTRSPAPSTAATRTAARATTTATNAAAKSPIKRIVATSTTGRPTTTARQSAPISSRNSSTRTSKSKTPPAATNSETSSNAVKSIRTRALVDAGQKAAAVAATTAAVAATASVALAQDSVSKPTATTTTEPVDSDIAPKREPQEQETLSNVYDDNVTMAGPAPSQLSNYIISEPNLIFTTTEAGNMLADEIAQAERAASENLMREQQMPREDVAVHQVPQPVSEPTEYNNKSAPDSEASELVNGLAGGLVSTEDRYDSSERDGSLDGFAAQQTGQVNNQQALSSNDDEPYSIIPTTYDSGKHNDDQFNTPAAVDKQELEPQTQRHTSDETEGIDTTESQVELRSDGKPSSEQESSNLVEDAEGEVDASDHLRSKRSVDVEEPDEQVDMSDDEQSSIAGAAQQEPEFEKQQHPVELGDERREDEAGADSNREALLTDDVDSGIRRLSSPSGDNEDESKEELVESISKPEESSIMAKSDDEPLHLSKSDDDDEFDRNLSRDDLTTETDIMGDDASKTSPTHDDTLVKNSANELSVGEIRKELEIEPGHSAILFENDDTLFESADDMGTFKQGNEDEQRETPREQQFVLSDETSEIDQQNQQQQQQLDNIDEQAETRETIVVNTEQQQSDQLVGDTQAPADQQARNNDDAIRETGSHSLELEDEIKTEPEDINKGELLMNVADLMEIESIKKQEMSKKAELARTQSNSRGSLSLLQTGEILLSPDQLNEQFAQLAASEDKTTADDGSQTEEEPAQEEQPKTRDLDADLSQATEERAPNLLESPPSPPPPPQATDANRETTPRQVEKSDDLLNFGSITPTNDDQLDESDAHAQRFDTFEVSKPMDKQVDELAETNDGVIASLQQENLMMEQAEHLDANLEVDSTRATKSTTSVNDDDADEVDLDEDEEQQKLSNHLTNSDDDVILEPRNTKIELDDLGGGFPDVQANMNIASPSRYNEGAGLGLLAREELVGEHEETTTELAGGLSAEIVSPTVAENRVEVATSKSMMPELSQAATFIQAPKLTQEDDSDSDDLELNPNADPIDVAATMSPSSSVAEELLRLSRQASSGGVVSIDQFDDHEHEQRAHTEGVNEVSPKHDDVRSVDRLDDSRKESLVDRGINLLDLSSQELRLSSCPRDLAQELVNKTIDDTLQTLSGRVGSLSEEYDAVNPINNNEITSDNSSGSRKQSVDRNGDSVSAGTVVLSSGPTEEDEEQEQASGLVLDRSNPGLTNGATTAAAAALAANDDISKVDH